MATTVTESCQALSQLSTARRLGLVPLVSPDLRCFSGAGFLRLPLSAPPQDGQGGLSPAPISLTGGLSHRSQLWLWDAPRASPAALSRGNRLQLVPSELYTPLPRTCLLAAFPLPEDVRAAAVASKLGTSNTGLSQLHCGLRLRKHPGPVSDGLNSEGWGLFMADL